MEKLLQHIFDSSPDIIGFANLDGYFEKINDAVQKILGYSPAEFCGSPFLCFVHPDDQEKTRQALLSASHGKRLIEIQNRYRCKNGDCKWIDWKVWATESQHPFIAVGRDITERQQLKQALTASEKRYEMIAASARDSIFIKDANRRYTFVNPAMARQLGMQAEALLGKTPEQIFDARYAAVIKEVDDKTFRGETVDEIKSLEVAGQEYVFHTIQFPLEWKDGQVISISGIVRDITDQIKEQERKNEMDAQRLQIQKLEAIGTLAGGIAHDFNNLLGVILGYASYAQQLLNKEDPLFDILSNIQAGARQAENLTRQLLTFAKGGAPVKQPTDLNRLVEESARFATRGSKIRCAFEFSKESWPALVDPGQINQVIGNIVLNAVQAMADGGTIRIRTDHVILEEGSRPPLEAGRYIAVVIQDNGTGIPDEVLPRIFDPYFSTRKNGSGLGLATAYSIIKKHGGHIGADSTIHQGTTVTLFLPASAEWPEPIINEEAVHHGSGRILVMDDHTQILTMAGILLNDMGYQAAFASGGLQAIEMYRQAAQGGAPYDLVILDLTVPGGVGGAEALSELKKIDPDIKAVVSSGYANDPIMANYADYGFCGVLPKPYTKKDLSKLLHKTLNH